MSAELKPCPFCGGPALITTRSLDERFAYATQSDAVCKNCRIGYSFQDDQNPKGGYALGGTGMPKAIAAWNRRADLTPPAADYVAGLIEAGDVMANALRGRYIVPGSAAAWQKALAVRPASPDTRVTPQEAAQVLLEWWNQDTPDVGQIAIEARKVIAVTTALKDHESQPFEQVNAMLKAIIAGGQDRG